MSPNAPWIYALKSSLVNKCIYFHAFDSAQINRLCINCTYTEWLLKKIIQKLSCVNACKWIWRKFKSPGSHHNVCAIAKRHSGCEQDLHLLCALQMMQMFFCANPRLWSGSVLCDNQLQWIFDQTREIIISLLVVHLVSTGNLNLPSSFGLAQAVCIIWE